MFTLTIIYDVLKTCIGNQSLEDLKASDMREEQLYVFLQICSLQSFCVKVPCAV